jgi:hypothetical protein
VVFLQLMNPYIRRRRMPHPGWSMPALQLLHRDLLTRDSYEEPKRCKYTCFTRKSIPQSAKSCTPARRRTRMWRVARYRTTYTRSQTKLIFQYLRRGCQCLSENNPRIPRPVCFSDRIANKLTYCNQDWS